MDKKKIARINELSRKQRTNGLSEAEKAEQRALRDEFRAEIRGDFESELDRVCLKNPDGSVVKAKKEK